MSHFLTSLWYSLIHLILLQVFRSLCEYFVGTLSLWVLVSLWVLFFLRSFIPMVVDGTELG